MSKKSTTGLMEKAVLNRLILDLGSDNELYVKDAINFLDRPEFMEICTRAKYPDTLLLTLKQLVLESAVQRKHMAQEILGILTTDYP